MSKSVPSVEASVLERTPEIEAKFAGAANVVEFVRGNDTQGYLIEHTSGLAIISDSEFGNAHLVGPETASTDTDAQEVEDEVIEGLLEQTTLKLHGPLFIEGGLGAKAKIYSTTRNHLHVIDPELTIFQEVTERKGKGPDVFDAHTATTLKSLLYVAETLNDSEKITIIAHSLGAAKLLIALSHLLTDDEYKDDAERILNSIGRIYIDAGAGVDLNLSKEEKNDFVSFMQLFGRLSISTAMTPIHMRQDHKNEEEYEIAPGSTKEFAQYLFEAFNESLAEGLICRRNFLPLLDFLNQQPLLKGKFLWIFRELEATVGTEDTIPDSKAALDEIDVDYIDARRRHDGLATAPSTASEYLTRHGIAPAEFIKFTQLTDDEKAVLFDVTPTLRQAERLAVIASGKTGFAVATGGLAVSSVGLYQLTRWTVPKINQRFVKK